MTQVGDEITMSVSKHMTNDPSSNTFFHFTLYKRQLLDLDKKIKKGFRPYTNINILHVKNIYISKYFISDLYFDFYNERTKITFVNELKTRSPWPTY